MKKICIIGAGSGIGKALSEYYVSRGESVASITRQEYDLSKESGIIELADHIQECSYDLVIFSAGVGYYKEFLSLTSEQILEQIYVNTLALLQVVKSISRETKFVYLSSVMQYIPAKNMSVYAGAKRTSSQVLATIALETQEKNILCIDLGAVKTDMHIKAGMKKRVGRNIEKVIPKLVHAIETQSGNITLFLDWKIMICVIFPLYRLFLGIKSIGNKF